MSVEYFGGCPECGRYDYMLNVHSEHYFICQKHKTAWCIGSNLIPSWEREGPESWEQNRILLQEYTIVEPHYCNDVAEEKPGKVEAVVDG